VSLPGGMQGAAALLLVSLAAAGVAANTPHVNYMLQCQGCHLPDGRGQPPDVPSFEGLGRFLGVEGGREYLIRVPGASQSPLDDAELAELLNWMVKRYGPASAWQAAEPYTEAEVSALRRPPLAEVESVRRRLLREIQLREIQGREASGP